MHAAPGFLGVRHEGSQFLDSIDPLGGIGVDEVETAVDRMAVRIDETGEEALAVEIGAGGVGSGFCYFRQCANSKNLITTDGERLGVGILGIAGEDFRVEEDLVLRVQQRGSEKQKAEMCEGSAHGYLPGIRF